MPRFGITPTETPIPKSLNVGTKEQPTAEKRTAMEIAVAFFNIENACGDMVEELLGPTGPHEDSSAFSILGSLVENIAAPRGSSFLFLVQPERRMLANGGSLPAALVSTCLDKEQVNQHVTFRSPTHRLVNPMVVNPPRAAQGV